MRDAGETDEQVPQRQFNGPMGPFTDEPELDALAVQMFRQFSRFEYALKAAGHHPKRGDALADWTDFAAVINQAFQERLGAEAELREAVDYLMGHPPKKQRVVANSLVWKTVPAGGASPTDDVLIYVRRVRNNLFHGGKYSRGWIDPERSEPLVRHSLTVLEACLLLSERVRAAYEH